MTKPSSTPVKPLKLTKIEKEMVLRAMGFADAGEWPWEPYKKSEGRAFNSAMQKIADSL